jgi:hypothetical protein
MKGSFSTANGSVKGMDVALIRRHTLLLTGQVGDPPPPLSRTALGPPHGAHGAHGPLPAPLPLHGA